MRTVWRDLRVLQDAGFPSFDERDGRHGVWRVDRNFQERIPLSLPELVALLMRRDLLGPAGASPLGPAVASAFAKIRALLHPRAFELIDRMRATVGVRAPGAKLQAPAADYLPAIQSALVERRRLRLRYYSMSRAAETERRVDPYHLTYWNGGLYLIGHCHLRRDVRMFAVERIRGLERVEETFEVPPDFNPEDYLRSAWGMMRGDLVVVRVAFSGAVAPYIRERLWHPSQEIREVPGARLELTLRVADTLEVRRWLLGFGADAEVIEPASLREAIQREAERLVAMPVTPSGGDGQPASPAAGNRKPLAHAAPPAPAGGVRPRAAPASRRAGARGARPA